MAELIVFLGFSGDDDPLRRGTFHEARGAGWAIAQRLPSDGYDAEGAFRFSQTSLRRQVCRDSLYIIILRNLTFPVGNKEKRTAINPTG